ncbi:rod shape-determining protein MreD [Planctomycetota bacterium]
MGWVRFAVLILVACLLQAGMLGILAVTTLNVKPDLLLILLVFFAVYSNTKDAIITSFVIGFTADVIGTAAMGPKMLSFGLIGTLLANLTQLVAVKKMPHQAVVIFLTALLTGILAQLLSSLKGQPAAANIYTTLFGMSLYSAIIGPFLFLPSAWWMRIKTHQFSRH